MESITVIYSPLCEANGAFLGRLEEWLEDKNIEIVAIPFDAITAREKGWYQSAGLVDSHGRFKRSVFIDLFFEGRLIDSVPLRKEKIERALNIRIEQREDEDPEEPGKEISIAEFRSLILGNEVEWFQINRSTYRDEMRMCLENYPYGNPSQRFHQRCLQLKENVFDEVFTKEHIAGVFAKWQGQVIGLLEVFPKEIIKRYGYLAGRRGEDEDYLTIGCLEVGYGIPRKEMIDELMFHLELSYPDFRRHILEGVGTFEWSSGFRPYWVYDKYGFHRSDAIDEQTVIMEKLIHENKGGQR